MLALLLALPGPARAAEVWVESAPVADRATAEALLAALPAGEESTTGRVLRRFVKGAGWQYVVRVEGMGAPEEADQVARALQRAGGRALVLEREGDQVRTLVDTGAASVPPTAASDPSAEGGDRLPDARAVLREAVKAHGGERGGLDLVEVASTVTLVFEREVAIDQGRLVAANRYYRLGDALRLEVEILEGAGTDSTTIVTTGNEGWVVAGGEPTPRDVARTREVLARFAPDSLLEIPLGFARDVAVAAAWDDLRVAGPEPRHGTACWRLEPAGGNPAVEGLVAAWFAQRGGHLIAARWRSPNGELDFDFADYREVVPGVVVPFRTSITRNGRPVEQVRLLQLLLDTPLEPGMFAAP
ncbi:hypothetical protein L6R53_18835 [Myxococcota bacterium]|nr:hypothetical protein [Myxococcota bacterium]